MSLRGLKGRGNLLRDSQQKPSSSLRLLRSARNDGLWPDVFYKAFLVLIMIPEFLIFGKEQFSWPASGARTTIYRWANFDQSQSIKDPTINSPRFGASMSTVSSKGTTERIFTPPHWLITSSAASSATVALVAS